MADLITISICNFNTTQLTNNCIKSIFENFKSYPFKIVVLDNSDKYVFNTKFNVSIIDNTKQQLINFDKIIKKISRVYSKNNYASFKHCYSIQFLLNICNTDKMLLFDSDTKLLKDIDFINDNIISAFNIELNGKIYRALPYIQYFNVKMMNMLNIKYFDAYRMHGGFNIINDSIYDTGASFYEDCIKYNAPIQIIDHKCYIWHKKQGSW